MAHWPTQDGEPLPVGTQRVTQLDDDPHGPGLVERLQPDGSWAADGALDDVAESLRRTIFGAGLEADPRTE